MQVFMARQPILDRELKIFGYELLFRGGTQAALFEFGGDCATSQVLSNTIFTAGLERITAGSYAFVNFTKELLTRGIARILPAQTLMIEILEDVEPDDELLSALHSLKNDNYRIALDDFIYRPSIEPLIDLCDMVKFDFLLSPPEEIRSWANKLKKRGKLLLAEKIETMEDYEYAKELGFDYFQGYFFSRPQLMSNTAIPGLKITRMQIMSEVAKPDFCFDAIERIIRSDLSISYKLLKYINSPFFRRIEEIDSIHRALVMIGESGVRRFLAVIILSELTEDRPGELLKSSVIRAKLCEELGRLPGTRPAGAELFTLGLFSLIDAILETPMDTLLKDLPLSEELKLTLTGAPTALSDYLALAQAYEAADWPAIQATCERLGLELDMLPEVYLEALTFADGIDSLNA